MERSLLEGSQNAGDKTPFSLRPILPVPGPCPTASCSLVRHRALHSSHGAVMPDHEHSRHHGGAARLCYASSAPPDQSMKVPAVDRSRQGSPQPPKARTEMAPGLPVSRGLRRFLDSTTPTPSHRCKSTPARRRRSSVREVLVSKQHLSAFGTPPMTDMTSKPREYTSKKRFRPLLIPL